MSEKEFDGLDFEDFDSETIDDVLPPELVEALRDVKNNPPEMDWRINQPKMDKFVEAVAVLYQVLPLLNAKMSPLDLTPSTSHRVTCIIPEPMRRIDPKELHYLYIAASKFDDVGFDFCREGFVIMDLQVNDVYYPVF